MESWTWLKDANGNRCAVEWFGSEKAAQKALDSLIDCKNCTNCSGCSRCSWQVRTEGEKGEFAPPAIPKIENIHQVVYEAVSKPEALDMGSWHSHTCNTMHCRAGWVVHLAGEAGYALGHARSPVIGFMVLMMTRWTS